MISRRFFLPSLLTHKTNLTNPTSSLNHVGDQPSPIPQGRIFLLTDLQSYAIRWAEFFEITIVLG